MAHSGIPQTSPQPYQEESINLVYELLFCDDIDLYKANNNQSASYPWNVLFSETPDADDLQKIVADSEMETRVKILACNQLRAMGEEADTRELLAVIVEVGLDNGLDVLASYQNGSARYINYTGKVLIWEANEAQANLLTNNLFSNSISIVSKIGPWNGDRQPYPAEGNLRITFLVSDGLYFGEGPINALFSDPLAGPALQSATELMQYLTEKVVVKG